MATHASLYGAPKVKLTDVCAETAVRQILRGQVVDRGCVLPLLLHLTVLANLVTDGHKLLSSGQRSLKFEVG